MKSYLSIALKYLSNQKKRTILTILGVIMSTALFTGIFTIMTSMHQSMLLSEIKTNGDYHIEIKNLDSDQYSRISNLKDTDKMAFKNDYGIVSTPLSTLSFNHIGYSENMFDIFYYDMANGKYPTKENEIMLPDWTRDFFETSIKTGSIITIEDKEYTISGFYSPSYYQYGLDESEIISFLNPDYIKKTNNQTSYVKSTNPIRIEKFTDSLEEKNIIDTNKNDISYNTSVLKYYGNSLNLHLDKSIYIIIGMLICVIIFASVAVIYNSFHISLLERMKQFGILRAIGASKKQISKIVLVEAFIISILAIPLGIISGALAIRILLDVINNLVGDMFNILVFSISYEVIVAASILGFISTILSALGPALRAKKISPIQAIRNTENIKVKKKKSKFKFIKKALPVNLMLASNNLKRNKKRYRITVFSIAISIALFILFSSFSNLFTASEVYSYNEMGDFYIYTTNNNSIDTNIIKEIKNIEGIKSVYKNLSYSTKALVPSKIANAKLLSSIDFNDEKTIELNSLIIQSYGNDFLAENSDNLIKGKISLNELKNNNDAIVYSKTKYYDSEGIRQLYRNFNFSINDKITTKEKITFNISGILDNGMLDHTFVNQNSCVLFVSEETFKRLFPENKMYSLYLLAEDIKADDVDKVLSKIIKENPSMSYINYHQMAKDTQNLNTVINIFLFGFIAIISLISSLNIINTLWTNIILRKKELSILKAIGMSTSKLRNLVITEGVLYSIQAAIYGSIAGTSLSYLFYKVTTNLTNYPFNFPFREISFAFCAALIVATISSLIPFGKINKANLIDNLRQS